MQKRFTTSAKEPGFVKDLGTQGTSILSKLVSEIEEFI
jgi:hypothetical protein